MGGTLPTLPAVPIEATNALPARYRDLGRIGHGNMGEVRRVHDTTLERDVAMKLVHAGLVADPELRRRLFNEAKLTAALDHPAIVAVHDMGLLEDGRSWFTMRIVAGETLGAVVGDPPAPGEADMFVLRFDAGFGLTGRWQSHVAGYESVSGLAIDPCGRVVVSGYVEGTFVPGQAKGGRDGVIARVVF